MSRRWSLSGVLRERERGGGGWMEENETGVRVWVAKCSIYIKMWFGMLFSGGLAFLSGG